MNETLGFGIIGTGRISDWVLQGAVLDPRFRAVAVCSRSAEKGASFAARHGIPLVFTDPDEMAASPAVQAVYIGTPNHTHCDLTLRCLSHGKPVLCEKPLASNAVQARQMADCARERGLLLMEAMISTLNPNFRKASDLLPRLGKVRHMSASFCQYSSRFAQLRRILKGSGESLPSSFNPHTSGGALMDIGVYTVWPLVALFGKPLSVKADLLTVDLPIPDPSRIDIQGSLTLSYPGMTATAVYSKAADAFAPTEICCEEGNLLLDKLHICRRLSFIPHGAPASGRGTDPQAEDISCPPFADEYTAEITAFIDRVLTGEGPVNSVEDSVTVLEIMDEIRRQGGIRFPDDPAEITEP